MSDPDNIALILRSLAVWVNIRRDTTVVGTAPIANTNRIDFESISLVAGDVATKPSPQSPDDVERECQRYYNKSFINSTAFYRKQHCFEKTIKTI